MLETGLLLGVIGVVGVLLRSRNLLETLMAIEVMLSGIVVIFASASLEMDDVSGLVMALTVLVVAAAESCIGLGMLVSYYGLAGSVSGKGLRLVRV